MKTTISVTIDSEVYNWAKIKGINRSEVLENELKSMKNGVKKDELEAKYNNLLAKVSWEMKETKEENEFLWQRIKDFQNKLVK